MSAAKTVVLIGEVEPGSGILVTAD
jgi:hypothetical protein